MIEACGRLGLDTTEILQAARLDLAVLQDPDSRIPVEQGRRAPCDLHSSERPWIERQVPGDLTTTNQPGISLPPDH
jgi:hypothetical protein